MIDDDSNTSLRVADDGTLWVMSGADSTLFRIDTTTGQAVEQFRFSHRPSEFVVTDTSVVVISYYDNRVMMVPRTAFEQVEQPAP